MGVDIEIDKSSPGVQPFVICETGFHVKVTVSLVPIMKEENGIASTKKINNTKYVDKRDTTMEK